MYKLYDWLAKKMPDNITNDLSIIDVGAYHGDFTQTLLATKKVTSARLFEPNVDHYTYLKNKFLMDKNIFLYPYALGNQIGSQNFNCSQDGATGSLLQYHQKYHHELIEKTVKSFPVEVTRLDDFYAERFPNDKIGLIKIDTQGFDLEVLKGAEKLIREHKPWLVIELNFLPFYNSQAPINSVFDWLANCGYTLGGFFNDHYSNDQWLAFADGVFVPESTIGNVLEPFSPRIFSEELIEKNKYLQSVCDERLKLINELHNEAESRLNIINIMKLQKVKKSIFSFLRK